MLCAGILEGYVLESYGLILRLFRAGRLLQRLLFQNLIQLHHGFIRFHHGLGGIHNPVDHSAAGRSKQGVKDKVCQHLPAVSTGSQKKSRRYQQGEAAIDTGEKGGLPVPAAHGILTGQITVGLNRRIKSFKRIYRLLEHLDHRDSPDILYGLRAHISRW